MRKGQTLQPPEMRCISRHFNKRRGTIGWRVSLRRSQPVVRHFIKYFPDHAHGGEALALAAAQAWRDELQGQYPRATKEDLATLLRKHNTSGTPGVYRKVMRKRAKNGSVSIHILWQAQTPLAVTPFRSRSFSVAKFGEEDALRRAIQARKEFEALLGAG